jgi:hypothetical protein
MVRHPKFDASSASFTVEGTGRCLGHSRCHLRPVIEGLGFGA